MASLQSYASLLRATDGPAVPTLRLLRMPEGALAVAVRRVYRNSQQGESVGTLVFGRYLHTGLIERLEQTSQSPVRATLLDEHGRPALSVSPAVGDWLASVGQGSPDLLVQTGDPATLRSHALLRDIEGRPLVVLSTTVSRAALQIGKRTITWVVAALLCGFALVVALLVSLLNRSWRNRAAAQRQWLDHQRKMSRLARRDALTGLPNRLHLQRLLPRLLARAARDGSRVALLNLDLDHFKNVNDSLGHGSGDRLLAAVAHRLRSSVAAHDVVVRMGGDEFVVVATMLPDSLVVDSIAERIRGALAVPLDIDGVTLSVVPSIGISVYPEDGVRSRATPQTRRHRALHGEGPGPRQSPVLYPGDERAPARARGTRARLATGPRQQRVVCRVPAVLRPPNHADGGSRGAHPLAHGRRHLHSAVPFHPDRRAEQSHRRDRRLRAQAGVRAAQRVAARAPAARARVGQYLGTPVREVAACERRLGSRAGARYRRQPAAFRDHRERGHAKLAAAARLVAGAA